MGQNGVLDPESPLPKVEIDVEIKGTATCQCIRKSVFQLTWFDIADVTFRRFLLLIQLWNRLGNRLASFFRLLSYVPPFFSISGWISWRKFKCSFPDVGSWVALDCFVWLCFIDTERIWQDGWDVFIGVQLGEDRQQQGSCSKINFISNYCNIF